MTNKKDYNKKCLPNSVGCLEWHGSSKSSPQSDSEINLYAALFVVSCWEGWGLWCYILYFKSQPHNLTVSIICKFQSLEAFLSTEPGLKTNFYSSLNLNMNVIRRLSKDHNGWMPGRSISFYTLNLYNK